MAYWNQCYGNLVLSGKKYDGKGFGLRGVWNKEFTIDEEEKEEYYTTKNQFPYITFVNGREAMHVTDKYLNKFRESINMPWDYEFGTHKINISEDTVNNCIHLNFGGGFRDGGPNVEKWVNKDMDKNDSYLNNGLRNWFIEFVKSLIESGWNVKGTYTIKSGNFFSGYYPDEVFTVVDGISSGLNYKIASIDCEKCINFDGEDEYLFRTYRYYLHDSTKPEYLYSTKIFKEIC